MTDSGKEKLESERRKLVKVKDVRVVQLDLIQFDLSYQRGVMPKHRRIITDFDLDSVMIPLVAQRDDGSLWCVDGRQRITAMIALGYKSFKVEVFASSGPEHEAKVFVNVNKHRTQPKAIEVFNADLTNGDKVSWEIKTVVDAAGFQIPRGSTSGRGATKADDLVAKNLCCIRNLRAIHRASGQEGIKFVLRVIKAVWPDDDRYRTKSEIVGGLGIFYNRHDEIVDEEKLVHQLSGTAAIKLLQSSTMGVGGREENTADAIEKLYVKRRRKG